VKEDQNPDKHRLIAKDLIAFVLIVSISYVFIVFIESRYDDREFKDLLIDHETAIRSFEDIEQYATLQRISDECEISLNKKNII
jgi:hypothetical protein